MIKNVKGFKDGSVKRIMSCKGKEPFCVKIKVSTCANFAVGGLRRKSNRCFVHYMYVSKE